MPITIQLELPLVWYCYDCLAKTDSPIWLFGRPICSVCNHRHYIEGRKEDGLRLY